MADGEGRWVRARSCAPVCVVERAEALYRFTFAVSNSLHCERDWQPVKATSVTGNGGRLCTLSVKRDRFY